MTGNGVVNITLEVENEWMSREWQTEHMHLILLSSKIPLKLQQRDYLKRPEPTRVGRVGKKRGTQLCELENQWMSHNLLDEPEKAENSPGLYHRILIRPKN